MHTSIGRQNGGDVQKAIGKERKLQCFIGVYVGFCFVCLMLGEKGEKKRPRVGGDIRHRVRDVQKKK